MPEMEKVTDEYDHLVTPDSIITEIVLSGVTENDEGYITVNNDSPDFFSVYIREADGISECTGDFTEHRDALNYAIRMANKYQVPLKDAAQQSLNSDGVPELTTAS